MVLSRRKSECVDITTSQGNIEVMVVDVRESEYTKELTVRLGFKAPKEITIHRREVTEAIKRDGPRLKAENGAKFTEAE